MKKVKDLLNKYKLGFVVIVAFVIVAVLGYAGYLYAVSPESIRNPRLDHAHLRMQLVVDGQEVNFGEAKFQESYEKGQCSAELPKTPIHLHDSKNQFVHLHWKGISGGLVLKNYGWDMISGPDNILGYRLDKLPEVQSVKTFGNVLPDFPKDAKLWVYTGDENSYQERSADEFLKQDFETFFSVKSSVNSEGASLLDWLFPKALAHGTGHANEMNMGDDEHAEMITRIHNLLGNVVVFAQKEKPTDQQIKERFERLEPLGDSVCGG